MQNDYVRLRKIPLKMRRELNRIVRKQLEEFNRDKMLPEKKNKRAGG